MNNNWMSKTRSRREAVQSFMGAGACHHAGTECHATLEVIGTMAVRRAQGQGTLAATRQLQMGAGALLKSALLDSRGMPRVLSTKHNGWHQVYQF